MKIALTNIEVDHALSAATHYFYADLVIEGHKAVQVHDAGYGDDFIITPYDAKGARLFEDATRWCLACQADLIREYKVTPIDDAPVTLEALISELLQADIEGQLFLELKREQERAMVNHILFGVPGELAYYKKKLRTSVEVLLSTERGTRELAVIITTQLLPSLSPEQKILNTNFPAHQLTALGIPPDKMAMPPVDAPSLKTRKKATQQSTSSPQKRSTRK